MSFAISILRLALRISNRLLPFTDPTTPLIQDLTHTAVLCTVLYFAPQIFNGRNGIRRPPLPRDLHTQPATIQGRDIAATDPVPEPEFPDDDEPDEDPELHWEAQPADAEVAGARPPPAAAPDRPDVPGPALADRPAATRANRAVGAKKAASLVRRDQRRAYHEFVRSQAEAQRTREAEGAEEREAALFEEKRRRAVAEMEIEERARREREERREKERVERGREVRRREVVVKEVREGLAEKGAVDLKLGGWGEREWVEKLVKASGILGERKSGDAGRGEVVMLTEGGWVVRVDEELMRACLDRAMEGKGRASYERLAEVLDELVRERAKMHKI